MVPGVDSSAETKNVGLRGVTVADTRVSHVDGEAGRLIYRGYGIGVLAQRSTYEEVAYLLIEGTLPTPDELEAFTRDLAERRELPPYLLPCSRRIPASAAGGPAPVGRARLASVAPRPDDGSKEAEKERARDLTAKFATVTAAWHRVREGLPPVAPDPALGHAADFLRMLHGTAPDPRLARQLDIALILHADHSMNASTFTARTVTSTRATIYAAVSAAHRSPLRRTTWGGQRQGDGDARGDRRYRPR